MQLALAHQCCCVFLHKLVRVPQTGQALGEYLSLHHHLCQVHRVLCNLAQRTAHLCTDMWRARWARAPHPLASWFMLFFM